MEPKPKLLIIPGWSGSRDSWRGFIELAEQDFDVHCIELPCFGAEPCPDSVWGVEDYANFVKSKINNLKSDIDPAQKVVVLGHSFGGQIAVQLVGANPNICDTLILSGPAIFRKKWSVKRFIFLPLAKIGKAFFSAPGLRRFQNIARVVLYKAADSPDYSKTEGRAREIFRRVTTEDVSRFLPFIAVPTLIVTGERDVYVRPRASARAAKLIPRAQLVRVPKGVHGLQRQDPAGLLKIIKNYLAALYP